MSMKKIEEALAGLLVISVLSFCGSLAAEDWVNGRTIQLSSLGFFLRIGAIAQILFMRMTWDRPLVPLKESALAVIIFSFGGMLTAVLSAGAFREGSPTLGHGFGALAFAAACYLPGSTADLVKSAWVTLSKAVTKTAAQ